MKVVDRVGVETAARTRVYRTSSVQKAGAFLVLAAGCFGFLRNLFLAPPADDIKRIGLDLTLIGLVLTGVWMVLSALWSKVTWSPESIEVRTLTETTQMPLDAIRGRREYETRGSKGAVIRHFVLVPKDDQMPTFDFTDRFSFDNDFRAWYSRLPDLDAQDAKKSNSG